jgi:uncharacterized protein YprB with RNaseH-like and TPR domain
MPPTLADRIRGMLHTPDRRSAGVSADSGPETPPDHLSSADLESVLGGKWRQRDGASCFVVETRCEPSWVYGGATVGTLARRLEEAALEAVLAAGVPAPSPFGFVDLETTGLSGGAGTYAFLAGWGRFDDDGAFVTRQYLLVRFADERSLLGSVASELARVGALVSFNGKSFDAPLLETRFLYHRLEWIGARRPHIDMLHVARRFWRRHDGLPAGATATGPGCSLIALERELLGASRPADVPGFEIPSRYFHFVRTGDARQLGAVFEHNRLDLLSLAALTVRALHLLRVGPSGTDDPREALALGWFYARGGLDERAQESYERAVDLSVRNAPLTAGLFSAVRVDALRSLALARRRSRAYDEAAGYWRQLLDARGCPRHIAREASEALAIHHEHRVRDLATAKAFALRSLENGTELAWNEAVRHRLARIDRKMESRNARGLRLAFPEASDFTVETCTRDR